MGDKRKYGRAETCSFSVDKTGFRVCAGIVNEEN
jgi:hypothetical protein